MKPLRLLLLITAIPLAGCMSEASMPADAADQMAGPMDDAGLAPFFGYWEGATVDRAENPRAAFLLVEETENGFTLAWQNLSAGGDDGLRQRRSTLLFTEVDENLWLAENLPATVSGESRLDGNVLTTTIVGLTEDGDNAVQVYERRVDGDALYLSYRYRLNDTLQREIEAEYMRAIDP